MFFCVCVMPPAHRVRVLRLLLQQCRRPALRGLPPHTSAASGVPLRDAGVHTAGRAMPETTQTSRCLSFSGEADRVSLGYVQREERNYTPRKYSGALPLSTMMTPSPAQSALIPVDRNFSRCLDFLPMRSFPVLLLASIASVGLSVTCPNLPTADFVQLNKYLGTW